MHIFAPAKINLHLHVTGKTEYGHHLLDSLVVFADIGDRLTFAPAENFSFTCENEFAGAILEDNSVCFAARLLADKLHKKLAVAITLQKNLPVASGIGGGSADAAATLWGLRQYWDANITDDQLRELALKIGSDVPVCLKSMPATMRGVGEILSKAPELPELPVLLVWPNKNLSTADVYNHLDAIDFSHNASLQSAYNDVRLLASDMAFETRNDLTAAACRLCPEIKNAIDETLRQNGCLLSRMSGSGSTVFGLFETADQAVAAEKNLSVQHPDWWIKSGWLNRVSRY